MDKLIMRMAQFVTQKKLQKLSLTLVIMVVGSGMIGGSFVSALGTQYWDDSPPGDCDVYGQSGVLAACKGAADPDGETVDLIVGQTYYVRQTGVKVRAYFKSQSGILNINNSNFCEGHNGDLIQSGDHFDGVGPGSGTRLANGSVVNKFWATSSDHPVSDPVNGLAFAPANPACDAVKSIHLSNMPEFQNTGVYYTTITVAFEDNAPGGCSDAVRGGCDGIQNSFTLQESPTQPGNNYIIASVGDQGESTLTGYRTTSQQNLNTHQWITYMIRFGAACDADPNANVPMNFYDLDNLTSDGQGGYLDGSPGDAQYKFPIQMDLIRVNDDGSQTVVQSYDHIPSKKNDVTSLYHKGFTPGERYILKVKQVYYNNTIQFSTPYDGIYYKLPCEDSSKIVVNPTVSLSPSDVATVGQTVTASFGITNSSGTGTGHVEYKPTYWFENKASTDASTYNSGEGDMLAPGFSRNNVWQSSVSVPPGGFNQSPDWDAVADQLDTFKLLCGSMELRNPGSGTSIDNTKANDCTPLGKIPSLHTQNGDIRTGGRFPGADNGPCTVVGADSEDYADNPDDHLSNFSIIGHSFGGSSPVGSWADYGIFSTGRVINFGSNSASSTTGPISKYLLFANSLYAGNADGYFFYNTNDGGIDIGKSVTTACFSNLLNGKYAGGGDPTPIASDGIETVNVDTDGTVNYEFTGDGGKLIIHGGTVPSGARRIINVTNPGTGNDNVIVIDGNIILDPGSYTKIKNLPSFVLLSGGGKVDTRVDNDVTQLDGIYAVNGDFNTCDGFHWTSGTNQLGSGPACDNKLEINGTLMIGRQIYPYRTAGQNSEDDTSAAETIDLRPDVLLGDYARGSSSGGLSTVYQQELPPRF